MRTLLLLALIIPLSAIILHAQTPPDADHWIGVGGGFAGGAVASVIKDGSLYVLWHGETTRGAYEETHYRLARLDGAGWTEVNSLYTDGQLYSMCLYRGQFYIGGEFTRIGATLRTNGIARLNGNEWEEVTGGNAAIVTTMIDFQGSLYVAGNISLLHDERMHNIARWDGARWHAVGGETDCSSDDAIIDVLTPYHGELYAKWVYRSADSLGVRGVTRWDGHAWTPLDVDARLTTIFVHDDKLYVGAPNLRRIGGATVNGMARWDGSAWSAGTEREGWMGIGHLTPHNGTVCATAADGATVVRWNGSSWDTTGTFDQYLNFLIDYNGGLYAGGWFYVKQNHIARLCEADNCGQIAGSVYHDRDGDCVRGAADTIARNRFVEVTPGPFYAPVDANGNYALYLPFGAYNVRLRPYLHWSQGCHPAPYAAVLSATDGNSARNDFAMAPDQGIEDLRISLAGGHVRPGEPGHYVITYSNVGTVTMSGTVRLTLDPVVAFVSSTAAPDRVAANIIEWDFANLKMEEKRSITVITRTGTGAPVGDTVCARAEILGDIGGASPPGDAVLSDNADTWCPRASNSYDPNDMQVAPLGIEGNGELAAADSVLTYLVRFQNTGTDTAFTVVVTDTLSPSLDITTLQLGAASHDYRFAISGSNVLIWTFADILLPDSGANEPESHGFFKYTVHVKPGLPPGTRIPNRAAIYFDYNTPVLTNTVVSVITNSAGVAAARDAHDVEIFPNPTAGSLRARGDIVPGGPVRLSDAAGRRVEAPAAWSGAELTVDLAGLPAGVYFLSLRTPSGTALRAVTVTR